jgi:hypothetical protein
MKGCLNFIAIVLILAVFGCIKFYKDVIKPILEPSVETIVTTGSVAKSSGEYQEIEDFGEYESLAAFKTNKALKRKSRSSMGLSTKKVFLKGYWTDLRKDDVIEVYAKISETLYGIKFEVWTENEDDLYLGVYNDEFEKNGRYLHGYKLTGNDQSHDEYAYWLDNYSKDGLKNHYLLSNSSLKSMLYGNTINEAIDIYVADEEKDEFYLIIKYYPIKAGTVLNRPYVERSEYFE